MIFKSSFFLFFVFFLGFLFGFLLPFLKTFGSNDIKIFQEFLFTTPFSFYELDNVRRLFVGIFIIVRINLDGDVDRSLFLILDGGVLHFVLVFFDNQIVCGFVVDIRQEVCEDFLQVIWVHV